MSWAKRRQTLYITVFGLIVCAMVGAVAFLLFSRPTSCTNGVRDGLESGVDCGGTCARVCSESVHAPIVLWTRYFEITPGVISVAAYVQNQNQGAYVAQAPYNFKIYSSDNTLIAERRGVTLIQVARVTPVIETNIAVGNRVPARAFFEFTGPLSWEKTDARSLIVAGETSFAQDGTRVSSRIENVSGAPLKNVSVAAVLFDASGTAVGAARSLLGDIPKGSSADAVFTWPSPSKVPPVRVEITPITASR